MMNLLKYTLLTFLLSFAACSSEDDAVSTVPNGQLHPGDALALTVSAADFVTEGAPDTRATDDGNRTTFDDNDRVGIIILDANNNPIYDNIPYKYDSSNKKWIFDSDNDKGGCYYDPKAETYIVYYPYSRAADGVRSEEDLKTKFAPKFNQSDIKDYRSSDLMVWRRTSDLASSVTTLDAKLEHAFASVYLAPIVQCILDDGNRTPYTGSYASEVSGISDVSLTIDNTVYVPFQASDGSLRCIVPAGITPGDIRCFYTIDGKTYGNTINISGTGEVAANTRYACEPKIGDVTYSLSNAHVGDFYCKRSSNGKDKDKGYLIPSDFSLTPTHQTACLGIVFWVGSKAFDEDPLLQKDHPDCSHGLVVALQDAALNGSTTMNWSNQYESVQNSTDNIYKSDFNIQEPNKMCGYSNTLALKAYNTKKGDSNGLRVLPCDAIQQYSKDKPAPTNSSGWYFPSVMELKYVCWGQEKGQGTTGRNNLNAQISVSGGSPFDSGYYWSSTEHSSHSSLAWRVDFGNGRVSGGNKDSYAYRVRPLLAF